MKKDISQAWKAYKQEALQAPDLTPEQLESIYHYCQQQPSLPVPPLPAAHPVHRFRAVAIIALIAVAGLFLLLLPRNNQPDTPMLAQLAVPDSIPPQLPATPQVDILATAHNKPANATTKHPTSTPHPATVNAQLTAATGTPHPEPQPAAPPDSTIHHFILSPDNVQIASIICNSEICDTQYYVNQILNDLLS